MSCGAARRGPRLVPGGHPTLRYVLHPARNPSGEQPAVTIKNLVKRYGSLLAVDDVSFSIQEGEIFGIIGPNGAGKTTTVECISGLLLP
jgi:ABC-type glutathione transport system ATPase component